MKTIISFYGAISERFKYRFRKIRFDFINYMKWKSKFDHNTVIIN